jgi:TolA-binding protein
VNSKIDHSNVSADLLQKYFNGKLSEKEKNALEKLALDDPFLKDAMEGFEFSPESLDAHITRQKVLGKKFNGIYLIIGTVLTAALCMLMIYMSEVDKVLDVRTDLADNQTEIETTEVELLPDAIDTLTPAPIEEQIKITEVVENKKEIQKTVTYTNAPGETPILIEEEFKNVEDFEIIPENSNFSKAELVPATHLHDLFVVDYRRIEREHTDVIYTKYEFSGTSAEFETENHENNAELLETKVEMPYWEYLSKTLEFFSRENYKNSLNRFLTILEQYPEDMNALFYGGLCYYNLGNFNKALDFFEKLLAIELNAFKEEGAWYKAKTLLKLGRKNEAKIVLDEIIAGGGFYTEDAINLKKKI